MKRIENLSKSEVLALTNEEIKTLIDLECAYANVPLLPPEPVKPNVPEYKPDLKLYSIFGFYFKSHDEANKLFETFGELNPFSIGYSDKCPKRTNPDSYDYPKITIKEVFSEEMYNRIKAEKESADEEMGEYNHQLSLYKDACKQYKEQADYVWGIIGKIREEQHTKEHYTAEFERYLSLSDNNRAVAWNFLKSAHPDVCEIEGLFGELVPPVAQEAEDVH